MVGTVIAGTLTTVAGPAGAMLLNESSVGGFADPLNQADAPPIGTTTIRGHIFISSDIDDTLSSTSPRRWRRFPPRPR